MKQTILRFSLLFASGACTLSAAHAQQAVPNGALETWGTRFGADAPAQWLTTDDLLQATLPGFALTQAVTRTADVHGGSYAAKLTNTPTVFGGAPGFLALGTTVGNIVNVDSLVELGGLPYTSRAGRLQFYYKFTGAVTSPDSRPVAAVLLTKTVNGVRQTVARGRMYLPTSGSVATTYTLASIPLVYRLGTAPDSVHIAFGSGDYDGSDFPTGNSLYIDDVALVGTVAATRDAQLQAAVQVFPNPSAGGVFKLAALQDADLLRSPLTVLDGLGRTVLKQAAAPAPDGTRTIDLSQCPAGVYTLHLASSRGPVVKQLVVQ